MDEIRVAFDTVNGCSLHPYLNLMAVATGNSGSHGVVLGGVRVSLLAPPPHLHTLAVGLSAAGHRRYPMTSCKADADDSIDGISNRILAHGGGTENALRVFRMGYEMLDVAEEAPGST